ncbi:MFS transporter [Paracoccus aminophilus]|uniref:Cyanate transport protein n=1 Tax=Paracoccus aminophilus JCM 7686 TaxID=1367847 RepID=S5YS03_PARAH|nr:MFS transporter [Paracoccus aminophilus]AGT08011.1 cyanate transport protein [Paracoccus aminophilus JCM 7686]
MIRKHRALLAAILLLSLSLRPVMAVLGPVIDLIELRTGLSSAQAGLLTTLPILVMGLVALAGGTVRRVIGEKRGIAFGALCLTIACAMRLPFNSAFGMLFSAALGGLGIALTQALLPGLIKRHFGMATGTVMALYTTGIMTGSALGAASSADLARLIGWQASLALWALPALAGLIVWWLIAPADPARDPGRAPAPRLALSRLPRAWQLVVFFGLGTGSYTLVLAWLPPYYQDLGLGRETSGYMLAGLTITEVFAGLAIAAFIDRFPDRRGPLFAVLAALMLGLILLVWAPVSMAIPAMILLGIGIGSVFPLGLIVTMDHASNPEIAGDLAGFVQGWGYILASALPFVAGAIKDHFASLTQAWYLMMVGVVVMAVVTLGFSRDSYARFGARSETGGQALRG